ncbi:hypothetical protein AO498_03995 [Algoriphagus sanaruensis]|uniref:Uncharacterized protein n=1 Tax=Algoriphagus sanaruensis TaxID=1727163 RepID=A0A142EK98_9BACT|nr:hypothetical protein AO498_03995 [Algoriphagus sanaruensis]
MNVNIKCIKCNEILTFATMTKQSMKQSVKQSFDWKVMLGLKKIEWVPTCEQCNSSGKENFCCPECGSSQIWTEDILKTGNLIHKCK